MRQLLNSKGQVVAVAKKNDPTTFRMVSKENPLRIREDMVRSFHLCFIEYRNTEGKTKQISMFAIMNDGKIMDGDYVYRY